MTSVSRTDSEAEVLAARTGRPSGNDKDERRGFTAYNDSDAVCYLKLGTGASATSFTVAMAASSYYESPYEYQGAASAVWASAGDGALRVTELRP